MRDQLIKALLAHAQGDIAKHRANVEYLLRNNLRAYRQVTDIAEVRETQLNNGQ